MILTPRENFKRVKGATTYFVVRGTVRSSMQKEPKYELTTSPQHMDTMVAKWNHGQSNDPTVVPANVLTLSF